MQTKFKDAFADAEVKKAPKRTGYYCEWGVYHEVYYGPPCTCWDTTSVDPKTMVRLRKEMFPYWADGQQGRPPKGHNGNAMTKSMQKHIIARAKQQVQVRVETTVQDTGEIRVEDLPF